MSTLSPYVPLRILLCKTPLGMAVSLPDYVGMLNLKEDVTCSLVAPCLITYLHLHAYSSNSPRSSISVDEGVRYSTELFCISCSPSAVTGRFRRLAKKHERLFIFQDGVLSCNSCDILISSSTQSSHHVNLMIGSLCMERLQMCLPHGLRASVERSWKPVPKEVGGKQAAIDENSFLLARIRKIIHDDYTKKREALEASIALLDQTWESPLKEIEAMLADQVKADTRPLTPQPAEQTSGSTTQGGRRKEVKVDHSAADSGHADPAKTDLLGSQRAKIREAWHAGAPEAYQRVVDLSLTVIHVSTQFIPHHRAG